MANPIIQRELIGLLRTRRALMIQLIMMIALAALVLTVWPDNANVSLDRREARQLLGTFVYGLLVALLLLAPVYPATAIVRERQSGTLVLLLTSPLSAMSVLIGKVSAALGFIILLLLLSLPAAAACYVMGGIDATQMLSAYGLLALVAVQYAMIGLLVSSFARSSDSALRLTYGLVLAMSVIVLGPYYMMQGKDIQAPGALSSVFQTLAAMIGPGIDWLRDISPIPAVMETLGHRQVGARGLEQAAGSVQRHVTIAAVVIVVCIAWLALRLRPALLDRSRSAGKITDERSAGARAYRRVMFLWFFDPQRRGSLIGADHWRIIGAAFLTTVLGVPAAKILLQEEPSPVVHIVGMVLAVLTVVMFALLLYQAALANPVLVKEYKTRSFGRPHWQMRLVGSCLVVSLMLMLMAAQTQASGFVEMDYLGSALVIFQMGLIILITPALASGLIASEVESGGWLLMLSTPLAAWRIVFGKLFSVMLTLFLLLLATLPGYLVLLLIDPGQLQRVIDVLITLALTSLFALVVGAACSSIFRRTAAATTCAYVVLVGMCVGTLLPWLGAGRLFGENLIERALQFNPLAAALSIMGLPAMANYQLVSRQWDVFGNWHVLVVGCVIAVIVLWVRCWYLIKPK